MPYLTNDDLPTSVRQHLPEHGQNIYGEAFNHTWQEYAGDLRQEEIAHRVAWAAVKRCAPQKLRSSTSPSKIKKLGLHNIL
jgi:cation transport regulator